MSDSLDVEENGRLRLQAGDVLLTGETVVPAGAELVATVEQAPVRWGETECSLASKECNPCVEDVVGTFEALFGEDDVQESYGWHLEPEHHYPPEGQVPKIAFAPGIAKAHIQTLVRTNSPTRPLAAVYSGRFVPSRRGSLLLIDADLNLERIYRTWDQHPTGLVPLGRVLLYGDKNEAYTGTSAYVVRMFPLDAEEDSPAAHYGYLRLPDPDLPPGRPQVGGGMTVVRLSSGGFLLAATGPGGNDPQKLYWKEEKYTDFFYMLPAPGVGGPYSLTVMLGLPDGDWEFSASIEHLARWSLDPVNNEGPLDKEYDFSENVSSVVECGTGDVYLIHAGTKRSLPGWITFYRLSRVRWESGVGPQLEPLVLGTVAHHPDCTGRASATVWADGGGGMELYCSEYRMDNEWDDEIRFTRRYVP